MHILMDPHSRQRFSLFCKQFLILSWLVMDCALCKVCISMKMSNFVVADLVGTATRAAWKGTAQGDTGYGRIGILKNYDHVSRDTSLFSCQCS